MSLSYRNFVGANQKKKIKQTTISKPIGLRRILFLVLQKDGREEFAGIQLRLTITFGHWPNCSIRWRSDRKRGTRRWLRDLHRSFLWRSQCSRVDTMCEIFQMGAHTLCWYGGRFCLWALSRINTLLFFLCICNFFKFCNYSLYFLGKLFTSPNVCA